MDGLVVWATLICWMHHGDPDRLSWSVRHDRIDALDDALLEDLVDACRDACASRFPATDGYVTSVRRLSGAMDGASINILRGRFRALVSVQRFLRTEAGPEAEVRVVACCGHEAPADLAIVRDGSGARWVIAGCAIGTMGVGAAGLELSGLLGAWGQMLLLIPALIAWKICAALQLLGKPRHSPPLQEDPAVRRARARTYADDRRRWHELAEVLATHREAVTERFRLRPFRSQGTALPGMGMRSLEPATTAIPRPVLPWTALPSV